MREMFFGLTIVCLSVFSLATAADLAPETAKAVREILEVGFEPGREG